MARKIQGIDQLFGEDKKEKAEIVKEAEKSTLKESKPEKKKTKKYTEKGLRPGDVRHSIVINKEKYNMVKKIIFYEGKTMRQAFDDMVEQYISKRKASYKEAEEYYRKHVDDK
jgi:hypothetical protein